MARLWQQIMKGEKGQALPVVLVLLVLGGLLIAPCLSYASTSLNAGQIVEKNVKGVYAADAGVENTLWCLKNSIPPPTQLSENVNQMQVEIDTVNSGNYTLYYGDLIVVGEPPQNFPEYLAVDGEMGEWDEVAEAYPYTITVTWQADDKTQVIYLEEVGVRLPIGYSYKPGSAASFFDNLSIEDPVPDEDGAGAYMLNWGLNASKSYVTDPKHPNPKPERTQTFYITGEGEQDGDYAWVKAQQPSIGKVGEVIGTLYRITATATRPEDGEITARVMADATLDEATGEIRIILWQINPRLGMGKG